MATRHLTKYIEQYSEPLIQQLSQTINAEQRLYSLCFDHVIVIPAYKEDRSFISKFLTSSHGQSNTLVIIVVNQPDYEIDSTPQTQLWEYLANLGELLYQPSGLDNDIMFVQPDNSSCYLCCVDAYTNPIPEQQGVGLARKIGADIAVLLKQNNQLQSEWIHSTDADATLPENYFSALKRVDNKTTSAVSYNFTHFSDAEAIHRANMQYETALRYYVRGMEYAKSPYAFYTIGSVIAFTIEGYVKVRGFPKRSAGEDFYLLNKLAKLGTIGFIENSVVKIQARESNRVPFGTGPTVSKIVELNKASTPYCYYHPQLFTELKQCLSHFDTLWNNRLVLTNWLSLLSVESQKALLDNGFEKFVNKQRKNTQEQFNKQLVVWFDAFKTLKFLHSLREQGYSDIPLEEALTTALF